MSHSNEDKKECEGCYIRQVCELDTSYIDPKTGKTIICPCSICLVKVICNYSSPCDVYRDYSETVYKISKGI